MESLVEAVQSLVSIVDDWQDEVWGMLRESMASTKEIQRDILDSTKQLLELALQCYAGLQRIHTMIKEEILNLGNKPPV